MIRVPRLRSLRHRFLLVILLGAVLPLALVGWWLTRTAMRSGAEQLTAALDSSLDAIAGRIEQRWVFRRGDLALVSDNEVVRRMLQGGRTTQADSEYLSTLFEGVRRSMPALRYRVDDQTVLWSADADAAPLDTARQSAVIPSGERSFSARIPIRGVGKDSTRTVGVLEARIGLTAVLPLEETQNVVGHAVLTVTDRATGAPMLPAPDPTESKGWVTVRRALDQPPLDVALAAPAAAYVKPFERAAQLGLLALLAVSALVILLTTYLTTRLTSALEELVTATTAVARGDLQRNVAARGDDEVARLADAFNAMTESLRRSLHDLSRQQALAAVGEYAATLSHEVRNALSAVRMDLQRVEEQEHDISKSRALASRALENVRRLDLIVSSSLGVARNGRTPTQHVDIHTILKRAIESAEPTFASNGAFLDAGNDESAAWVDGDPAALERLFLNLLVNAGQAVKRGGRAQVKVEHLHGNCVVTIHDSGIGIPADQLTRVGEPFYTSKPGGTGLGLTIAKRIVAGHGGQFEIQSTPGCGTTARVLIPLASVQV